MSGNIRVVVRCRPLNTREIARGAKGLIRMEGNQTFLEPPPPGTLAAGEKATAKKTMNFAFDKSYWSAGPKDEPGYASQQTLYNDLGDELLQHAFEGFNCCIFAYGQTGSGKSYSMMGYGEDKGIIPLTCESLFNRIASNQNPNLGYTVECSYMEIYNEKVKDLLNPRNMNHLKVREHPHLGPYVEDLSKLAVNSYDEMMNMMDEGNKARTVAATQMNATSSRSHGVFTLILTQKRLDVDTGMEGEKVSRISLVDLAGSERANSTGATGQRLKEGANINKSLTTLGKVIAALAQASGAPDTPIKGKKKKAEDFVPYRDSVLTWLLKDNLGGNSKTAMIAAISPADYEETLSTLRYADQAKKIKNKAVVNEDPNAKLIRELKEELDALRLRAAGASQESTFDANVPPEKQMVQYKSHTGEIKSVSKADLQDQMEQSEKIMSSLNETWEEKLQKTQEIQVEREKALEDLGITVDKKGVGVSTPKKMPHLVNLNEDPLMSECLIYQIKPGQTLVGNMESEKVREIKLSGHTILDEHCIFANEEGSVHVTPLPDAMVMVNGNKLEVGVPHKLFSGYRIILGEYHVFRFNHPEDVRKARETRASKMNLSMTATELEALSMRDDSHIIRPGSPSESFAHTYDWELARKEATVKSGVNFDEYNDEDLDKIYEDLIKVRTVRKARPESRLSMVDGDSEWDDSNNGRLISGETITDDTSIDPSNAIDSEANSKIEAIPQQDVDIMKAQNDKMAQKIQLYQKQMTMMVRKHREMKRRDSNESFEPALFSDEELVLINVVLNKWKKLRRVAMAEAALTHAVLVKEANVMSNELKTGVSYNLTVDSGGALSFPQSALETIAGLGEFGEVSNKSSASTNAYRPTIAVRVIDRKNKSIYLWSLERLQQQLQRMRNVTLFVDRPNVSQHFATLEPFYSQDPPEYSFIGSSLLSLSPVLRQKAISYQLPIFCRYTTEALGSCKVELRIASVIPPTTNTNDTVSNGTLTPRSSTSATLSQAPGMVSSPSINQLFDSHIPLGSKVSLSLMVDHIRGLTYEDFNSIHLQVRLTSFAGPSADVEDVFSSPAVDLSSGDSTELKFRKTLTFTITEDVARHLSNEYAPIEFFAAVKPSFMSSLEKSDNAREVNRLTPELKTHKKTLSSSGRKSEVELLHEEKHDITAWLQMQELDASGEYKSVEVSSYGPLDPGSFNLRQGLQRRIVLTMSHQSGRQFPWNKVTKLYLGGIRLLDPKGRIHESSSSGDIELPLPKNQEVRYNADGSSQLSVTCGWDSGRHDALYLNRVTGSGQRVLLRIKWEVDIENCEENAAFGMDISVNINGRDRGTSKLLSFFSSAKILQKTSSLFTLKMSPPPSRSAKALWRTDTNGRYIHGEEKLGDWKARGISLVEDYDALMKREKLIADVQATKAVMSAIGSSKAIKRTKADDSDQLASKVVDTWKNSLCGPKLVSVNDPIGLENEVEPLTPLDLGYTPTVTLQARTETKSKSGYMFHLTNAHSDEWSRRFFVLRRPWLFIYTSSDELDEVGVVNLSSVKLERSREIEDLLQRRNLFTIYSQSNSYILQSANEKELVDWWRKINPLQFT
ncbi:kinesin-like protein [Wallemia mellicola]|nr:kinesin-like protein [Wallemia mellicola]